VVLRCPWSTLWPNEIIDVRKDPISRSVVLNDILQICVHQKFGKIHKMGPGSRPKIGITFATLRFRSSICYTISTCTTSSNSRVDVLTSSMLICLSSCSVFLTSLPSTCSRIRFRTMYALRSCIPVIMSVLIPRRIPMMLKARVCMLVG